MVGTKHVSSSVLKMSEHQRYLISTLLKGGKRSRLGSSLGGKFYLMNSLLTSHSGGDGRSGFVVEGQVGG